MSERAVAFAVTGDRLVRFTLHRTTAGDARSLLEGVQPCCAAIDPHDPQRVYVGTFDDGVYASQDGGETWRADAAGLGSRRVLSLAVSASHRQSGISVVYAGTEPSALCRSEDGGRTWAPLPALIEVPSAPHWSFPPRPWTHHVRAIALHPTNPDRLAVGIELGGVIRSLDGGASWLDHNPQAHSDTHALGTHPLAAERIYEVAGQGIARSEDWGQTWSRREDNLDRHYAWAQAIDPADPELWYVAITRSPSAAHGQGDGQAHLMRTHGDGWITIDNWGEEPPLRRMPYALAVLAGQSRRLLVGLRGGTLLVTDDAGESWSRLALALPDVLALAAAPA